MAGQAGNVGAVGAAAGLATGNPALMIGGSLLGMFGGGSEKSSAQITNEQINSILNRALQQAIGSSTQYTNQAIGQQGQSLSAAIDALTGYNQQAQQSATNAMQGGFQQSQQLRGPYGNAGYDSLDAWKKTLGLSTPVGGTANLVQNQQTASQMAPQLQSLLKGLGGNYALGSAPTAYTNIANPTAPDISGLAAQAQAYGQQHGRRKGSVPKEVVAQEVANQWYKGNLAAIMAPYNQQVSQIQQQNAAGQQQYNTANQAFQQRGQTFNQIGSLLQNMNPQVLQQLAPLLRGKI